MAPDLKVEGFLTDQNSSIPTDLLMKIIKKCDTNQMILSTSFSGLSTTPSKTILSPEPGPSNLMLKEYDLDPKPFARGKFAQIRRCVNKTTGQVFAGKFIKRRRRGEEVTHEILHEIRILMMAKDSSSPQSSPTTKTSPPSLLPSAVTSNQSCPIIPRGVCNMIQLHEVYEFSQEYVLILEMASGGELQHVLDQEEFLPEDMCRFIMRQILDAVSFLHENNIAHLDIKPQNILLTKPYNEILDDVINFNNNYHNQNNHNNSPNNGSNSCHRFNSIKLCDFGISRVITNGSELREIIGTPGQYDTCCMPLF